jgi:hypothetical protein
MAAAGVVRAVLVVGMLLLLPTATVADTPEEEANKALANGGPVLAAGFHGR